MSKRLIDANELISAMYYYEHNEGGLTAYDAQDIINKAPSIDIVRCKECVKRMREDCPMCNCCKLDRMPTEDDDYCSYGERKE